jgi:dTDP-4-dehydrorhamnose reductase
VFDVSGPAPRPTIVAAAAAAFARGEAFDHPVLDAPGWWRRPQRLYRWNGPCNALGIEGRSLLIAGATGTLGGALARICEHRGLPFCLTGQAELDLADSDSIRAAIARYRPWALINAAGFVRVADAENEERACFEANALGAGRLAEACAAARIPFLTFSSDLVFDGGLGRPCVESDPVAPIGAYGRSKAEGEARVLAAGGASLILRTSAFFGPWDRHNFAWRVLDSLARGETVEAPAGDFVSPTFVPDLCHAALDLLIDGETGIRHVANRGCLSWHDFALRLAEGAGYDAALVRPIGGPRRIHALAGEHGTMLRPLDEALAAFLAELRDRGDIASERMEIAAE